MKKNFHTHDILQTMQSAVKKKKKVRLINNENNRCYPTTHTSHRERVSKRQRPGTEIYKKM